MTFFNQISELIVGYTLQLTIRKEGDKLIVLLVPKLDVKKEDVQKEIIPLTIQGSADQLDSAFFAAISEGLRQTKDLQSNLHEFQASLNKAEKKAGTKKTTTKTKDKEEKAQEVFDKKAEDAAEKHKNNTDDGLKSDESVDKKTGEIKTATEDKKNDVQDISVKPGKETPVKKPAEKKEDMSSDESSESSSSNDEFKDEDW